jgi:hypothetical protein
MDDLEEFAKENKLTPVKRFTVLHPGWECDSAGLIARDSAGKHQLILTNHGSPYLAEHDELEEQISKLRKWLHEAEEAEELLLG